MSQLLASREDIEELVGVSVPDALVDRIQVEVYRTVRSELTPKYPPTVLAGWHDPEHTPTVVRKIAAKLIVAHLIGLQPLYDEGIDELKELGNGASHD